MYFHYLSVPYLYFRVFKEYKLCTVYLITHIQYCKEKEIMID